MPHRIISNNQAAFENLYCVFAEKLLESKPAGIEHEDIGRTQSQFNNKFVMRSMAMFFEQYEINPAWNVSATNYGKGPKNATVKKMTLQRVKSRQYVMELMIFIFLVPVCYEWRVFTMLVEISTSSNYYDKH